jgi:hypothetical protein
MNYGMRYGVPAEMVWDGRYQNFDGFRVSRHYSFKVSVTVVVQ